MLTVLTVLIALDNIQYKNFGKVVTSIASIDSAIEHHIINNCANASKEEEDRIDCINKANELKINVLNRIAERLVDTCGGEMEYIE